MRLRPGLRLRFGLRRHRLSRGGLRRHELRHLYERQFDQKTLAQRLAVIEFAGVEEFQRPVKEGKRTVLGLGGVTLALPVGNLDDFRCHGILGHHHVAYVPGKSPAEVASVEAPGDDAVEKEHYVGHFSRKGEIHYPEIILDVEDVQILYRFFVGDIALAIACHLVENGQGVAHGAVGLFGYHLQGLLLARVTLLPGHHAEVPDDVPDGYSLEVVNLAARYDGRQELVLFRRGEDEDHVGRRFLEGLEEGVEGGRREHVHLVDDEHLVASHLGRDARLLHKLADVLDGVVAGRVQLEYVERTLLAEGPAALALAASLAVGAGVHAVDGAGEYAGAGRFAHAARTAEKIRVREFARLHGVFERRRERRLSHNGVESKRSVLSG